MLVNKFIIIREIQMFCKPISGTTSLNQLGFGNKNGKILFLKQNYNLRNSDIRCVFENIKIKNDQKCERWKYIAKKNIR